MESGRSFEAGDVVYLTTELPAGGRIHEIGTRAHVVAAADTHVELDLGGTVIACSPGHVERAGRRLRIPAGWRAPETLRPRPA